MKTKSIKKNISNKNKKHDHKYYDFVTFIILCDLPGYRMKSYGPAPLLQIGKNKLIDLQLEIINNVFINCEIILCLGFDSESTIKYLYNNNYKNVRVVENQLFEKNHSCESLRLSLNNTNNNKIFILDGSLLFNKNLFKNISLNENLLFSQSDSAGFEISFNINEKNFIEHISYGASTIWTEILYINNSTVLNFKKLLSNGNFKNRFIFEAINELIKMKINFKLHKSKHNIKKINNIKNYHNTKDKR